MRGRTPEEIVDLLVEGIHEEKGHDLPITVIHKEKEAIMYAYQNVKPGAIITIMCDVVPDALNFIKHLKEEEEKEI